MIFVVFCIFRICKFSTMKMYNQQKCYIEININKKINVLRDAQDCGCHDQQGRVLSNEIRGSKNQSRPCACHGTWCSLSGLEGKHGPPKHTDNKEPGKPSPHTKGDRSKSLFVFSSFFAKRNCVEKMSTSNVNFRGEIILLSKKITVPPNQRKLVCSH